MSELLSKFIGVITRRYGQTQGCVMRTRCLLSCLGVEKFVVVNYMDEISRYLCKRVTSLKIKAIWLPIVQTSVHIYCWFDRRLLVKFIQVLPSARRASFNPIQCLEYLYYFPEFVVYLRQKRDWMLVKWMDIFNLDELCVTTLITWGNTIFE